MKSKCGLHFCTILKSEVPHRFDPPLPKLDLTKAEKFREDDSYYFSAMPNSWDSFRKEFISLFFSLGQPERRLRVSGGPFICPCDLQSAPFLISKP